jgi:hypothetical protein
VVERDAEIGAIDFFRDHNLRVGQGATEGNVGMRTLDQHEIIRRRGAQVDQVGRAWELDQSQWRR